MAYLAGNIASGFIAIGDVRDAIAGVVRLDFVSAGFSVAALIPIAGDAAAWIKKTNKYIQGTTEALAGPALRAAMKDGGIGNVSKYADKIKLLKEVSPNAVAKLTANGIDDATIIRLASKQISAKHFDDMIAAAAKIDKAPTGPFNLEKVAETWLRNQTPGALPTQIESIGSAGNRFYDVLVQATGRAIEVKHGRVYNAGRAAVQLARDVAMKADPTNDIKSIEWHFFTSGKNHIGPDVELLKELKRVNMPFTLWVS